MSLILFLKSVAGVRQFALPQRCLRLHHLLAIDDIDALRQVFWFGREAHSAQRINPLSSRWSINRRTNDAIRVVRNHHLAFHRSSVKSHTVLHRSKAAPKG